MYLLGLLFAPLLLFSVSGLFLNLESSGRGSYARRDISARPFLGSVPYGVNISSCTVPGTVALTFDDGPGPYTSSLLDFLDANNIKATFFIIGSRSGGGTIDTLYPDIIQRMYREGHQVAAHTWDHANLEALSSADRIAEMTKTETVFQNILGFFPTYMRPPFGWCYGASGCITDMANLGYHIVTWNVDTKDFDNDSPSSIQNSQNNWDAIFAGASPATSSFIPLTHDIHQQTVNVLAPYIINTATAAGFRFVTVGECLNDPPQNWYRTNT